MAWDMISEKVSSLWRASSGKKVDACGTEEETYPPIARDLYGDTGMVGTMSPANNPDLGRKWSVCPKGKAEF